MLHDDDIDLINRVLDATASAEEEQALQELRTRDVDIELYCRTMEDIYERLAACQRIAAPSSLVDDILQDLKHAPAVIPEPVSVSKLRSLYNRLSAILRRFLQ